MLFMESQLIVTKKSLKSVLMQCFILENINVILPQPKLSDKSNKLYIISLYFTDCIYKAQWH